MAYFRVDMEEDDDTVSTASTQTTMWETLRIVIDSVFSNNEQDNSFTRKHDAIDAGDNDRTKDFPRSKVTMKSLTLPIVICLTFPLVGVTFLSIQPIELGDHNHLFSSSGKGDIRLGKIIMEPVDVSHGQEAMLVDSSQLLVGDFVADVSTDEMLEEFLSAMSADWCALDEEPIVCFDGNAHDAAVEDTSTDQPSSFDLFSSMDMSDDAHEVASNTSDSIRHNHSVTNFGEGLLASTPSNYSGSIIKVEVNPPFLQFNIQVGIRYESASPIAKFPTIVQHSVIVNVLPREKLRAHSARKVLDVHCPNDQFSCSTSSVECSSEPQVLHCYAEANYWVGFQSLLEGFNDTELPPHEYFVPRTVRFILIREERIVDFWDLTAKVPIENDAGRERWLSGFFATVYTADLQDTIIVEPETTSAIHSMATFWNESRSHPLAIKEHQNSQSYSENEGNAENQDPEWEKLLIGCFSGMTVGLLLLFAPVFASEVIRLISDEKVAGKSASERDSCSKDGKMIAVHASFNASLAKQPSLSTCESALQRETIEHVSQYQHSNGVPGSDIQLDRESRHLQDVSSLPPVYPRQNQRITRKKMYSRQFETDLQNSKTPRRGNLKSSRQPGPFLNDISGHAQTETTGYLDTVYESGTSLTEENVSSEQIEDPTLYAPKHDANHADLLHHSSTLSSLNKTAQHAHKETAISESNGHKSEVSEHHPETISPPTIMRIIDPLPFSNPPPYPPSKVTPSTENHDMPRQSHEGTGHSKEIPSKETALSIESQDIDGLPKSNILEEESDDLSEHSSRSPMGGNKDETDELEMSIASTRANGLESTPNSPVFSDATFTLDNTSRTSDSNVDNDITSATKVKGHVDKDSRKKIDNDVSTAAETKQLPEEANGSKSTAMLFVPSPRKKTRRSNQFDFSQSPVSSIAAATADASHFTNKQIELPLTEERPISRRCGAPGQNKRFAASPASDELSFKSDSTFHDCGGERIGQRVAKIINGVICFGTVTEYDGRDSPEIWRVSYDDGSTHRDYYQREQLLEVIMHYKVHEKSDPRNENLAEDINETKPSSWQSSESHESDRSDDAWAEKEKRALEKKRARAERRLLRTARKPAIHKPSTALIPLSQAMDEPVWKFS